MPNIQVEVAAMVKAPADEVYPILADYQNHHPHILPKAYFSGLKVEEGGQGEGTIIKAYLKVMGSQRLFSMRITEPEPGRVLAETDLDTGLVTTFTVMPCDHDQAEVTIATTFQSKPGLKGWLERLTIPAYLRRIYRQELQVLDEYMQQIKNPR